MSVSLRKELIDNYTRNSIFGEESIYKDFVYSYDVEQDYLILNKYLGSDSKLYIDDCFDAIGSNFVNSDELEEVVLSKSIKEIYASAFVTSGLEKINLENVKYIGENAFAHTNLKGGIDLSFCELLERDSFAFTNIDEIKFGKFIHISKRAFSYIYTLKELIFNDVYLETEALTESYVKNVKVSGYILMEDKACLYAIYLESFDAVNLEHLQKDCFLGCKRLKYINFPGLLV